MVPFQLHIIFKLHAHLSPHTFQNHTAKNMHFMRYWFMLLVAVLCPFSQWWSYWVTNKWYHFSCILYLNYMLISHPTPFRTTQQRTCTSCGTDLCCSWLSYGCARNGGHTGLQQGEVLISTCCRWGGEARSSCEERRRAMRRVNSGCDMLLVNCSFSLGSINVRVIMWWRGGCCLLLLIVVAAELTWYCIFVAGPLCYFLFICSIVYCWWI